jgi:hypothetical protein
MSSVTEAKASTSALGKQGEKFFEAQGWPVCVPSKVL